MFELSVAFKYLIPRWRQLSVSIISTISVVVISLVVWLILVFFSVTNGLEKGWIDKLISLTAPVRITPTEAYYQSYYYKSDSFASAADYTSRTIGEKIRGGGTLYDPNIDAELPKHLMRDDKDLALLAYQAAEVSEATVSDYEMALGTLELPHQNGQTVFFAAHDEDSGIKLPTYYEENGVKVGDKLKIVYYLPTTSTVQEQQIVVKVSGFYDPGVLSIGARVVWAPRDIVDTLFAAYGHSEAAQEGINIKFSQLERAQEVKKQIQERLDEMGVAPYWNVETYRDFPHTRDFLKQLDSQRNLFSLLSVVIIVVACSNIISMLIILVNDKKKEIGVLRAMGAKPRSITFIFGLCGTVMGFVGSMLGITLAYLTLQNIDMLITWMSQLQGHELFNTMFFGDEIPKEISPEALSFVLCTTVVMSLISGIIPAIKASYVQPATILRAE